MKSLLLVVWLSSFAADAESTRQAMRRGGQEINPLLTQRAAVNVGLILGTGALTGVGMWRGYDRHPTAAKRLTILVAAIHGGATLYNIHSIQHMRRRR